MSKLETAVRQALAHHSAPVGEAEDGQDRKFAFRNGQFVNRVSGEPIPKDEPIIIFRARDRHALSVLEHYLDLAQDPHHQQAIRERIAEFHTYREANPERLKEPGITRDITLSAPPSTPTSAPVEDVGGLPCSPLQRARAVATMLMANLRLARGETGVKGWRSDYVAREYAALMGLNLDGPANLTATDLAVYAYPEAADEAKRRAFESGFLAALSAALIQPQGEERS